MSVSSMAMLNRLAHNVLAALLLGPGSNTFLTHLGVLGDADVPDGVLADLGDQLGDELCLAAAGNSHSSHRPSNSNRSGNRADNSASKTRGDDNLTRSISDENAISADGPEGLALPLGLVDLLEGVALLGGGHKVQQQSRQQRLQDRERR